MRKNKRQDKVLVNTLNTIKESSQIIAENTRCMDEKVDAMKSDINVIKENSQATAGNTSHISEKLDDIGSDMAEIKKSSTSKLPIILAILGVIAAISGISIADFISNMKTTDSISESEQVPELETEYKIYLYPQYSKFNIYTEIDMTAFLNFETDAVNITAYLASGREETVELVQKSSEEWQKKVKFTETGIHEVVVSATAPNGEVMKNSIEVEVTPISVDMDAVNLFLL